MKLEYDGLLSSFAFKFNLRRYNKGPVLPAFVYTASVTNDMKLGKGLHSSTFQLNVSSLYGIGGARRGCVARVMGVLGGVQGV